MEGEEKLESIAGSEQPAKEKAKAIELEVRKVLSDKARPGVAMKYTAEQYCQILQVALEKPAQSGRPSRRLEQSGVSR